MDREELQEELDSLLEQLEEVEFNEMSYLECNPYKEERQELQRAIAELEKKLDD